MLKLDCERFGTTSPLEQAADHPEREAESWTTAAKIHESPDEAVYSPPRHHTAQYFL